LWGGHIFSKLQTFGKIAFNQNPRLWSLLLVLPVLAWLLPLTSSKNPDGFSAEKVNLALRRTADGLLRASGDSTSRIPAVEQTTTTVWRVRMDQAFDYDRLPALLQASLELHGIRRPYEVVIRRCFDEAIDLGYHPADFEQNKEVACQGREMPEGCHYIELKFLEKDGKVNFWAGLTGVFLLVVGGLAGYWVSRRLKIAPIPTEPVEDTDWLTFGNTRLDVAGQVLLCGGNRETLTFRETKLLKLFASQPNKLLERDLILQEVWADEGILVGRSVDVFVSRLRKKLAADASIGIVAVHGVGYRLETGKVG
jgi:hypothetical protein